MKPKKANAPAPVLRIVQPPKDEEVIESLTYLFAEAVAGRITGIAYVATLPQKKYIIDTAGEANRNPLHALGAVHMLADELTRRLRPADE